MTNVLKKIVKKEVIIFVWVALEEKRIKENTYKTRQSKQRCPFLIGLKTTVSFFGVASYVKRYKLLKWMDK